MTIVLQSDVTCAVCGSVQRVPVIVSTSGALYALDGYPGGRAGYAVLQALMECEECGFCAPDITEVPEGFTREQIPTPAGPALADRWASWSLVCEQVGDYAGAGWGALKAAWASEAGRHAAASEGHRLRAAEQFARAQELGQQYAEDPATEMMIQTDVLRQAGAFERAHAIAMNLQEHRGTLAEGVIPFETALINDHDRSPYTLDDAKAFAAAPRRWLRRYGMSEEAKARRRYHGRAYTGAFCLGLLGLLLFDSTAVAAPSLMLASLGILALTFSPWR
jgi:hypothetical protein